MRSVAFLTDIEGRWDKLASFVERCPHVRFDSDGNLRVADGALFVFGGDAVDRGSGGVRILSALLEASLAQPERVVLLAGNRDINKIRLLRELSGTPPRRAPVGLSRPALLRWIFENTMAAGLAFDSRRDELAEGSAASAVSVPDEEVVESFLADIRPDGLLSRYLSRCVLAFREGETLFVHGGVTAENFLAFPHLGERCHSVDEWVNGLNRWYVAQVLDFRARRLEADGNPAWLPLVMYQAPHPGTRANAESVVYARPVDDAFIPRLPPRAVRDGLHEGGIARIVVGHTPCGDTPGIVRGSDFELVMADNSYSRLERGACVVLDDGRTHAQGMVELDDGSRSSVVALVEGRGDPRSPIGWIDTTRGYLAKGILLDGRVLLYRPVTNASVEQIAVDANDPKLSALRPAG